MLFTVNKPKGRAEIKCVYISLQENQKLICAQLFNLVYFRFERKENMTDPQKKDNSSFGHSEEHKSTNDGHSDNKMEIETSKSSPFSLENRNSWIRSSIRKSKRVQRQPAEHTIKSEKSNRIKKQPAENTIHRGVLRQSKSVLAEIKKTERNLIKVKDEVESIREETDKERRDLKDKETRPR